MSDPRDLRVIADLFATIWRTDAGHAPVCPDVLRALAFSGNYVAAAYVGGEMVGGSAAFVTPSGRLHSHITGVRPDRQDRGVAFALKLHQRAWALVRNIATIEWTYDPLLRRNAFLNLNKLAARGTAYVPNFYGAMTDGLNANDESDRLVVDWPLTVTPVATAASGHPPQVDAGGATVILDSDDGRPRHRAARPTNRLACWVPPDIDELRRRDTGLAAAWRRAVRAALVGRLDEGYLVTGMTRDGFYVLTRPS